MKRVLEKRKTTAVLFAIYMGFIVWVLLFKMQFSMEALGNVRSINLIPYGASAITNNSVDLSEIIQNALVFVPFGLYVGILCYKWPVWQRLLILVGTSLLLEVLQYALAVGRSDITDVINNCIGGIVGMLLYALVQKICKTNSKSVLVVNAITLVGTVLILILMALLIVLNL